MMTSFRRPLVTILLSTLVLACAPDDTKKGAAGGKGGDTETGGEGGGGSGGRGGSSGRGGAGGGGRGGTGGMSSADASVPTDSITGDAGQGDGPGAVAAECATAPTSLLCDPLRKMPKSIKETGLFPAGSDHTKLSTRLRHYVPDPALWTDGLEKERFMLLPVGKKIDNTKPTAWVFPVGTVFIKTFLDDSGAGGKPRAIETRFIRRVGTELDFVEYDYYLYEWNAQGTDATLVIDDRTGDDQFAPTVKVTVNHVSRGTPLMINNGMPFDHTLPSRSMCSDCHQENGVAFQTFIGFDDLRLNSKLTPTSAKTQLQEFQDADLFTNKPKAGDPPPRSIQDADPVLLKAKRFVFGNCVHCHNAMGKVFDLSPDVMVKNTVGQATNAQSVNPPMGWLRVVPGTPDMSVLYVQSRRTPLPMPNMNGGNRLRPMPPFGVNDIAIDQEGVAALRAWIMGLKN